MLSVVTVVWGVQMRAAQKAAFDAMYEVAHDVYVGVLERGMGTEVDLGIQTEENLIWKFHEAGMWTPDEIHETLAVSPLMHGEFLGLPQSGQAVVIQAVMDHRFELERRGMGERMT